MENGKKSAFTLVYESKKYNTCNTIHKGLTKREYFALQAMQGMLSNPNLEFDGKEDMLMESSVKCADALLKKLEK